MRRNFELGFVVLLLIVGYASMKRLVNRARENARRSSCQSNLKNLALGMQQYTADYSGHGPLNTASSSGWERMMTSYVKSCPTVNCPSEPTAQIYAPAGGGVGSNCSTDYWMNGQLFDAHGRGLKIKGMPANRILYGDGDGRKGTSYYTLNSRTFDPTSDYAKRHLNGANYAFVDGHVRWVKPDEIGTRWKW